MMGWNRSRSKSRVVWLAVLFASAFAGGRAGAQTECGEGNGVLNTDPPKSTTVPQLIQKFTAEETKVKEERSHYTYTQDVLVQSLNGKAADGQYHEVATISYEKGRREEKVTFAEQSTLRGINHAADSGHPGRLGI
jgi:hypothetical protein